MRSTTTLTRLGSSIAVRSDSFVISVTISASPRRAAATARSMTSGSIRGSSPWTFTTSVSGGRCCGGFRESIGSALVIDPGHDDVPAEPLNGLRNAFVVGGNQDPFDQFRLLNTAINVFNQCFTVNFDDGLSRETGGLISGRDDRNGAIGTHIPHTTDEGSLETIPREQAIADTHTGTREVRSLGDIDRSSFGIVELHEESTDRTDRGRGTSATGISLREFPDCRMFKTKTIMGSIF